MLPKTHQELPQSNNYMVLHSVLKIVYLVAMFVYGVNTAS